MGRTHCDNCGSNEFEFLYHGRDRLHGFKNTFSIEKCKDCGLIAVHPKLSPEEMEEYYPMDYISFPIAVNDEESLLRRIDRRNGINRRCNVISNRTKKTGRILDIGCATGNFLKGMQELGWECFGIEPSKYAAEYAKKRFNLNVFNGYLSENLFPDNFFDVITLWDVFEHLPDPKEDLKILKMILKPGGLLFITTPNAQSIGRRFFGKYWVGWDVPRHYHIFSPVTIRNMLAKASFKTKEIISFTGRHGAFILSVQFFLFDKKIPLWIKRLILSILRSLPIRIFFHPFYLLTEKYNLSSIFTVIAEKSI